MPTLINKTPMRPTYPAVVLFITLSLGLSSMASASTWGELSPQQQQALAPLANEWNSLSEKQQNNFIGIAKRYPRLTVLQQQRLQERMVKWSKLTPAQRQQAREKYKSFNQLPPAKREAEKQTLRERHARRHHAPAASAVAPASPAP